MSVFSDSWAIVQCEAYQQENFEERSTRIQRKELYVDISLTKWLKQRFWKQTRIGQFFAHLFMSSPVGCCCSRGEKAYKRRPSLRRSGESDSGSHFAPIN